MSVTDEDEYYDDNVGNYCCGLEDDTTVGRDVVYMHSNPSWHGITVRTCAVEGKNGLDDGKTMGGSNKKMKMDESEFKLQCRISCGADAVIENVCLIFCPPILSFPTSTRTAAMMMKKKKMMMIVTMMKKWTLTIMMVMMVFVVISWFVRPMGVKCPKRR